MATLEGLTPDFANRLQQLVNAGGGKITLVSGKRSNERQQQLWDAAVAKYGSEKAARQWVAPPGSSNHEKGSAMDLGGDIALAKKLAPQFGLQMPMSWEPWHIEPVDIEYRKDAYTEPTGPGTDHIDAIGSTLDHLLSGANLEQLGTPDLSALKADPNMSADAIASTLQQPTPEPAMATGETANPANVDSLDSFLHSLATQESGGDYNAQNPSGAYGKYQIMPSNWASWATDAGLTANAPKTPQNQELVVRHKVQQYHDQFGGDWSKVAQAWYGGPGSVGKNVGGGAGYPDSNTYAKSVTSRMK